MREILIGMGIGALAGIVAYKKIGDSKMYEKALKTAEKKLKEAE